MIYKIINIHDNKNMKKSTIVLTYIFISHVIIILYGMYSLSNMMDEKSITNCWKVVFPIILTFIGYIIGLCLMVVNCINGCVRYTFSDRNEFIVYYTSQTCRKGLMILFIMMVNVWNFCVIFSTNDCFLEYYNIKILNIVMGCNFSVILCSIICLWISKKCKKSVVI